MNVKEMARLYARAEEIVPFAEKDGQVYTDFEGASILNSINAQEPKTGMQTRNKDGSLASTGKTVHAMNPEYFYANRYMLKGKKLYIVSGHTTDGYRCIKEQASGRVFLKTIPAYIVSRDEKTKELVLEGQTVISDVEFISKFTAKLDNKSMAEILPLLVEGNDMSADSMPI